MKVLLAFDKFKDALPASEICAVAARAVRSRYPSADCDECPLTDGGDGFVRILTQAAAGRLDPVRVTGPRGVEVAAEYGLVAHGAIPARASGHIAAGGAGRGIGGEVAVIEMAACSGLALLAPSDRDPWFATSRGTGEMMSLVAEREVSAIILGVGGSASSDLGLGALEALGFSFRGASGEFISPHPANWTLIARIERPPRRAFPPVFIACDVDNPLCGPRGAAAVYGPQKGLRREDVERFDREAARVGGMLCGVCGVEPELMNLPGAGAAGGIAFGLMAALGARILRGSEFVADWLGLRERIAAADVVLTGEGCFDASSLTGKGPGAVVGAARAAGRPVHVFAGRVVGEPAAWLHAISPDDLPTADALAQTARRLDEVIRSVPLDRGVPR